MKTFSITVRTSIHFRYSTSREMTFATMYKLLLPKVKNLCLIQFCQLKFPQLFELNVQANLAGQQRILAIGRHI